MEEILQGKMMLSKKIWAVIGANNNRSKYGNIIFRKLVSKGYKVYPVNPLCEEVEGNKCYKNLSSLPEIPEVVNMVVSPEKGIEFIEEAWSLGIKNIWLQPGTYDKKLVERGNQLGLNLYMSCVLVEI